jgi:hypothetical protein
MQRRSRTKRINSASPEDSAAPQRRRFQPLSDDSPPPSPRVRDVDNPSMSAAMMVATSHLGKTNGLSLHDYQTLRRTPGIRAMTAPLSARHAFIGLLMACTKDMNRFRFEWQGILDGKVVHFWIEYMTLSTQNGTNWIGTDSGTDSDSDTSSELFDSFFGKHLMREYVTLSKLHAARMSEKEFYDVVFRMIEMQPLYSAKIGIVTRPIFNADTLVVLKRIQHFVANVKGVDASTATITKATWLGRPEWSGFLQNSNNMAKAKAKAKSAKDSNRAPKPRTLRAIPSPVAPATSPKSR